MTQRISKICTWLPFTKFSVSEAKKEASTIFHNSLADIISKYGTPTYYFNVGDSADMPLAGDSGLSTPTIVDILGEGAAYLIEFSYVDLGNPPCMRGRENYYKLVPWFALRPNTSSMDRFFSQPGSANYSSNTLFSLFYSYYDNFWDVVYPTDDNCTQEGREAFLTKIFNQEAISPCIIIAQSAHETIISSNPYFSTLLKFFENRIPYKGKYFNDLSFDDRYAFLSYTLPQEIHITLNSDKNSGTSVKIFTYDFPTIRKNFWEYYSAFQTFSFKVSGKNVEHTERTYRHETLPINNANSSLLCICPDKDKYNRQSGLYQHLNKFSSSFVPSPITLVILGSHKLFISQDPNFTSNLLFAQRILSISGKNFEQLDEHEKCEFMAKSFPIQLKIELVKEVGSEPAFSVSF